MGRGRSRYQDHWEERDEGHQYVAQPEEEELYEEFEYDARPRRRPRPRTQTYQKRPRSRPKRRVWPFMIVGCGLGIVLTVLLAAVVVLVALRVNQPGGVGLPGITNTKTFTREDTQQVQLASINQIQVCDKVGNVTVRTDPNVTTTTVKTRKSVNATTENDANQAFKRIAVEVQPPGTITNALACVRPGLNATPTSDTGSSSTTPGASALTVNVTFSNPNNDLLQTTTSSTDVTITMPISVLPTDGPKMVLSIEAPVGDITVEGISGLFNLQGGNGNVTVNRAILVNGSRVKTGQGNVNFNGRILPPGTGDASYQIVTEKGTIDLSLPSDTSITMDLTTNAGAIRSEYDIQTKTSEDNKGATYFGPLSPNANVNTKAIVHVDIGGSGDIMIHKTEV